MNRILTPLRVEAVLWMATIAILAAGIGHETNWGKQWVWPITAPETQSATFSMPALTEPFLMPAADTYLEIALRPLFIYTRRPTPPPPPPAPVEIKPKMKKDQFVLTGTTLVAEGRFAHLKEKTGNKSHVVAEGKEINGILVREVKSSQVILTQYDETEVVVLITAKAPNPPPTAQPNPANPANPANPQEAKRPSRPVQ
jgi:hypothetical protein